MRKKQLMILAMGLLALTACQPRQPRCCGVVQETYVHKYGLEIERQDWASRGKHGQVITTRTDGVVVTRSYDSGISHGDTSYTFPHSTTIAKVETYDQGRLVSETEYQKNGSPLKQTAYEDDQVIVTKWFPSGAPESKEVFVDDLIVQGEYFNESNQIESRVENGYGTCIRRDMYGQAERNEEVENGKVIAALTFHPDGSPKAITPYSNGKEDGQRKTFHPGGEPAAVEEWSNGTQHGLTVLYENGQKTAEIPYRQGKKNGVERRFNDNGEIVEEISWLHDMRHGATRSYVGNNTQTQWYFHDRPVKKGNYDMLSNPGAK